MSIKTTGALIVLVVTTLAAPAGAQKIIIAKNPSQGDLEVRNLTTTACIIPAFCADANSTPGSIGCVQIGPFNGVVANVEIANVGTQPVHAFVVQAIGRGESGGDSGLLAPGATRSIRVQNMGNLGNISGCDASSAPTSKSMTLKLSVLPGEVDTNPANNSKSFSVTYPAQPQSVAKPGGSKVKQ